MLKGGAGLHGAQRTYHSLFDLALRRYLWGYRFLVYLGRTQIQHGHALRYTSLQACFLHSPTDLLHMLGIILKQNPVLPQILFHPPAVSQTPQYPTEDQSVEPADHSCNLLLELCDKLVHGVLLPTCLVNFAKKSLDTLQETPFSICGRPRCATTKRSIASC